LLFSGQDLLLTSNGARKSVDNLLLLVISMLLLRELGEPCSIHVIELSMRFHSFVEFETLKEQGPRRDLLNEFGISVSVSETVGFAMAVSVVRTDRVSLL
jgi:hypothetical protein